MNDNHIRECVAIRLTKGNAFKMLPSEAKATRLAMREKLASMTMVEIQGKWPWATKDLIPRKRLI